MQVETSLNFFRGQFLALFVVGKCKPKVHSTHSFDSPLNEVQTESLFKTL